ncbi:MAG: hypothetical protein MJE12_03965 [Alphaproteobacteria bacterium]|nr:hypothetical protein [Alphaproteobacteria bacterium]
MIRFVICILIAGAVGVPAQALTFDRWNAGDATPAHSAVPDSAVTLDSARADIVTPLSPNSMRGTLRDHRAAMGADAHNKIGVGQTTLDASSNQATTGYRWAADIIAAWLDNPVHRDTRAGSFANVGNRTIEAGSDTGFARYWTMAMASNPTATQAPVSRAQPNHPATAPNTTADPAMGGSMPLAMWLFLFALTCVPLFARRPWPLSAQPG